MDIREMHYLIKLRMDKVDSLHYDNFLSYEIDAYLNRSQIQLLNTRYNINNIYKKGFEGNQKRIEDLKHLLEHEILQPEIIDNVSYRYNLDNLESKYFIHISSQVLATKGSCKINISTDITEHDDIYQVLKDDNYKPSFEWMVVPFVFRKNYMYGYSDVDFSLGGLEIDYLRYPRNMYFGDYEDFNGNLLVQQNSELPEHLQYELIDLTVLNIKIDIESPTTKESNDLLTIIE